MLIYIAKKLLSLVATLFFASIIIFVALELVPGDPASFMLGLNAQPDTIAALRAELGLDMSATARYVSWVTGMLVGDFGISYAYRVPVTELFVQRIWLSLPLAVIAVILSIAIAIPVGMVAAAKRGSSADISVMGVTQIGIAVPNFWFAMLLVLVFAIQLRWLPSGGFPGWGEGLWVNLKALILPAIALALPQASILARVVRTSLLDNLNEDYIKTARAKGLSKSQALYRHALRNALIPVLTIIGLQFSFLLAGTIIIENVFYLPGLGRLVFQSISQRDLIVVESILMLLVFSVVMVNFIIDITYALADPRLRKRSL